MKSRKKQQIKQLVVLQSEMLLDISKGTEVGITIAAEMNRFRTNKGISHSRRIYRIVETGQF